MSHPQPLPVGDALSDLVALVERQTAALSNAEAWPKILELAAAKGATGKSKGEFRDLVWKARTAAIEAKRAERLAKKEVNRQRSWERLRRRVERFKQRLERAKPDKLRALHALRREIVVEVAPPSRKSRRV